jgi:hypothetical protein
MKNTFFLALAAILFSASVKAQSTVDSIEAKYKLLPMPEALTIEKTFPVIGTYQLQAPDANTNAAVATTTTTAPAAGNVTITIDSVNKGLIWISGLPQGTMKAYLKKSPATYRILAQKTDAGKQIPEGTLVFDPQTRALNIELGAPYNDADPASVFTTAAAATEAPVATVKVKTKHGTVKAKNKIMYYTASKVEANATTTIQ